ncbi:hypothetical protein ANCDUO_24941, partial [Ancylostoma duodenale]
MKCDAQAIMSATAGNTPQAFMCGPAKIWESSDIRIATDKCKAMPKAPEWELDPVHLVPPSDWESKDMPRAIKQYMEYEWSLSSYTNECGEDNPLKIVPVYFWPGDQVDLPCLMCELAFVFNGKMKMWGKATNILKFLENPK